ncbi:DUF58 domain-containing protein [Chitinispirillales bacterium ANBcel5]|uniref:DUF58 domain-containing protein n=1 Tax=Cellulosispirillum alkaliphilum TaxID=3039283 RepID=UPI002A4FC10F|nr:DUF58 domain-containing protein [Chitinispirillales bacterium ANBcel5]
MIPKEIIQKVRHIEIKTKSIVNSILSGEYHSAFKGRGMEFSEVRAYAEGDDIRNIDWNVTARIGEPYVKKHIEERELTVMLVVDASASGNFGSVNKLKGEMAVELCALIAFSAIKNNDRVGLVIFSSGVERFIPPKKGRNHVLRVIRELLYFEPEKKGTDIAQALSFLNRVQTKSSVVFLVSDFIAPPFEKPLRVISRHHDVIAVTVRDPREEQLPALGFVELEDSETGEITLIDTNDSNLRNHFQKEKQHKKQQLSSLFRSMGVDEISVSTETDFIEPLVSFFKKRERKH